MVSVNAESSPSLAERLKHVRVGVRRELEVSRQILNGMPAYIIRDPVSFQTLRLTAEDYRVFSALNPEEELTTICQRLTQEGHLEVSQQDAFYEFVLRLTRHGLLTLPVSDGSGLYKRFQRRSAAEFRSKFTGFLSLRVPLFSPDAFLQRTLRFFAPLFTRSAFLIWLSAMIVSVFIVFQRWDEFQNPVDTVSVTTNLPILWTLLIVLKVIHEFGHAYACRRFGGSVPEMGALFVVFTPCAYVDASASWGFPGRLQRIIVALGGMYFESIIAMASLAVWCLTTHGTVHSLAQYIMLLSTVITIGFNANPLMKYDGYYVLSDLVGMPNLRADAQRAWHSLVTRILFGMSQRPSGISRSTEILLTVFGAASGAYKLAIVAGMSLMLALMMPALGIALAGIYLFQTLSQSVRTFGRLYQSPEALPHRLRIITVTTLLLIIGAGSLLVLPVPGAVSGVGVVERSNDLVLRAETSGFLVSSHTDSGDQIQPGQTLCVLDNPELRHQLLQKQQEVRQLRSRLQRSLPEDRDKAPAIQKQLELAEDMLTRLCRDEDNLRVHSPTAGQITNADGLRFPGRYVRQGDSLVKVSDGDWIVRVHMTAEDMSHSKPEPDDLVEVCIPDEPSRRYWGRTLRVARGGSNIVPDAAVTQVGGGPIPVHASTTEASQAFFEVTVLIPAAVRSPFRHGRTAWVKFRSEPVTAMTLLYRRGLQLLSRLQSNS
jgi:putative peptide zinc metalloprotease protein